MGFGKPALLEKKEKINCMYVCVFIQDRIREKFNGLVNGARVALETGD